MLELKTCVTTAQLGLFFKQTWLIKLRHLVYLGCFKIIQLNFVSDFSASNDVIRVFPSCITGINLMWSWHINILILYYSSFVANILFGLLCPSSYGRYSGGLVYY